MIDTKFDRKALAEVYYVLMGLRKEKLNKIPNDIIEAIKKNMDNKYEVDIDEIEKENVLPDTEKILATLYTYYLANNEEKKVIWDLIELKKKQNQNYFKFESKRNEEVYYKKNEQSLVSIQKENILMKILKKVIRIFWRN